MLTHTEMSGSRIAALGQRKMIAVHHNCKGGGNLHLYSNFEESPRQRVCLISSVVSCSLSWRSSKEDWRTDEGS